MVRLVSLAMCRQNANNSTILCQETDLSGVLFGKQSIQEMCRFTARELSFQVDKLTMASLEYKGNLVHVFKQQNGLACVAITDGDYSSRGAHGLIKKVLSDFNSMIEPKVWQNAKDLELNFPNLLKYLQAYKTPQKDKIEEIEEEIEKTKQIVIQSIDKVLANMDKLDDLVAKSEDLSATSRMFYKKSKKMNRCCTIL